MNEARGTHSCDLPHAGLPRYIRRKADLYLGCAEIRVFDGDGGMFASPNLIYHYVLEHRYRLPESFKNALLSGPDPGSAEYLERLDRLGVDWRFHSDIRRLK